MQRIKENYVSKLNAFDDGTQLFKIETFLYKLLYNLFKIEIPLSKYAPLLLNFFIIFTALAILFLIAHMLIMFIDEFFLNLNYVGSEDYLKKGLNIMEFLTLLSLIMLEVSKFNIDNSRWYSYKSNENTWRRNISYYNINTQRFLAISIFLFGICFITLFGYEFIIFSSNAIGLIVIYETLKDMFLYKKIKNWNKISIKGVNFDIKNIKVDDINSFATNKSISYRYSLCAKYSYTIKNKSYISCQVYADDLERSNLFNATEKYYIKEWINENNFIDTAYVNPLNSKESLLFNTILLRTWIGKYFLIFGVLIVILIVNYFM